MVGKVAGWSAAIAVLVGLSACSGQPWRDGAGSDNATPTSVTTIVGPDPTDLPQAGPKPPESGALVGAWVQPQDFTQHGRVAAIDRFEGMVGRKLDLVHLYRKWHEDFPTESDVALARSSRALMLSWAGTDTRLIASGSQDELIRERARGIASLGAPILLRWRWEMDRPNLRASIWSPKDYILAWKHIRGIFDEVGVSNVGWVWCPHGDGFADPERDAAAYYPGDDQVDWLCADVYADTVGTSFAAAASPFLAWAATHPKPIMIGEFGVRHGQRGPWIRDAFDFVRRHPQIKAITYFNGFGSSPRIDHRVEQSRESTAAFALAISRPYFHGSGRG